jgi:hypothetical protein
LCEEDERSTGTDCIPVDIDVTLEVPKIIGLRINGTDRNQLHLSWAYGFKSVETASNSYVTSFTVDISASQTFEKNFPKIDRKIIVPVEQPLGKDTIKVRNYNLLNVLNKPAYMQTLYIRVSATIMDDRTGQGTRRVSNSPVPVGGWDTWSCPRIDSQYLDATSTNPNEWTCID